MGESAPPRKTRDESNPEKLIGALHPEEHNKKLIEIPEVNQLQRPNKVVHSFITQSISSKVDTRIFLLK